MVEIRDLREPNSYTAEERLEQAQRQFFHLLAATTAYLQEHGLDPNDWIASVGQASAPSWEFIRGDGPDTMMYWLLLNVVSLGGKVESVNLDPLRTEAVVTGVPGEPLAESLGSELEALDLHWDRYGQVAAHLGLRFEYERRGDAIHLVIEDPG